MSKASDELKRANSGSIPAGLRIQAEISGTEDLVVHGTVEGPIQLAGCALTVGEKGKVTGDIAAREVVVHGSVIGNAGAHFKGSIEIGGQKQRAARTEIQGAAISTVSANTGLMSRIGVPLMASS